MCMLCRGRDLHGLLSTADGDATRGRQRCYKWRQVCYTQPVAVLNVALGFATDGARPCYMRRQAFCYRPWMALLRAVPLCYAPWPALLQAGLATCGAWFFATLSFFFSTTVLRFCYIM